MVIEALEKTSVTKEEIFVKARMISEGVRVEVSEDKTSGIDK